MTIKINLLSISMILVTLNLILSVFSIVYIGAHYEGEGHPYNGYIGALFVSYVLTLSVSGMLADGFECESAVIYFCLAMIPASTSFLIYNEIFSWAPCLKLIL